MDFTFNEEQRAVEEAVEGVFSGLVTPERVPRSRPPTTGSTGNSGPNWPGRPGGAVAARGLRGWRLRHGGAGLRPRGPGPRRGPGAVVGHRGPRGHAPGRIRVRGGAEALLPGVVAGDTLLTAALADVADDIAVGSGRPAVVRVTAPTACAVGNGLRRPLRPCGRPGAGPGGPGRRRGRRRGGPAGRRRDHRAGPHHQPGDPSPPPPRRGAVAADGLLAGGDPATGHEVLAWILDRAWTGLCALQVGVTEAAVAQTAEYLNTREQFGRPLRTFQGTMLRAADAAIDTESIRVTMWQAAWRLDNGLDADLAVSVASWFAAEAGPRAVHATQHLHGGMGADIELSHPPLLPVGQADRAPARPAQRPAGPAGTPAGGRAAGRASGDGMSGRPGPRPAPPPRRWPSRRWPSGTCCPCWPCPSPAP